MTSDTLLTVPHFTRLADYFGPWCYEPDRFNAQWRLVRDTDMTRHMAVPAPKVQPTLDLQPAKGGKSVAVIKATGTLMKSQSSFGGTSSIQLRRDVRMAASDPNVSAILLAVDSPGGTVAGTFDLAADVRAARRKKPVWAFIDDLGASAAYWVASQADVVYANSPTALVGSIGTFHMVIDSSKAAKAEGIEVLVFKTGPLKCAGAMGAEVTDEQRADYQRRVDQAQVSFDAAVRAGRGMNQSQLAAVRTGGVFYAQEAISLKLIDGIQSLEKTLAELSAAN